MGFDPERWKRAERYWKEQWGKPQGATPVRGWTPCAHFSQCIGYCPYCISAEVVQDIELRDVLAEPAAASPELLPTQLPKEK